MLQILIHCLTHHASFNPPPVHIPNLWQHAHVFHPPVHHVGPIMDPPPITIGHPPFQTPPVNGFPPHH